MTTAMKNSIMRAFVIFWMVTATSHSKARFLKYFKVKIQGYTFGKMKHFRDLWPRFASTHHSNITIRMDWWNLPCSPMHLATTGLRRQYGIAVHACQMNYPLSQSMFEANGNSVCHNSGSDATWKHFLTTDSHPNLRVIARELEYIRIFFRE
jgi:hypothetical protein